MVVLCAFTVLIVVLLPTITVELTITIVYEGMYTSTRRWLRH